MKIQIPEILPGSLVDDAKQNSEAQVIDQAAADEGSGSVLFANVIVRGFVAPICGKAVPFRLGCFFSFCEAPLCRCGRNPRALSILSIMKPNKPLILQVVIDRKNRHERDRLCGHWR